MRDRRNAHVFDDFGDENAKAAYARTLRRHGIPLDELMMCRKRIEAEANPHLMPQNPKWGIPQRRRAIRRFSERWTRAFEKIDSLDVDEPAYVIRQYRSSESIAIWPLAHSPEFDSAILTEISKRDRCWLQEGVRVTGDKELLDKARAIAKEHLNVRKMKMADRKVNVLDAQALVKMRSAVERQLEVEERRRVEGGYERAEVKGRIEAYKKVLKIITEVSG